MLDHLGTTKRTHSCGELRLTDAGQTVTLMGWVNRRRDHGPLIFIHLRDRDGITQIVLNEENAPEAHARAKEARSEYVLSVTGTCVARSKETINHGMETGEVEIVATEVKILNDARTPPFQIDNCDAAEEMRLSAAPSTCAGPRCSATCVCGTGSRLRLVPISISRASTKSKRRFSPSRRRRASKLPRTEPHISRPVLRASAVATALQAVANDRRLRALLSDRAVLSRRRFARRPPA